jgi:hypothetical protein
VPPLLGSLPNKNPPVMADQKSGMPASLAAGTALQHGKTIPSALITVATPAPTTNLQQVFGRRLPGPFTPRADIGLSPSPDSLNPALATTIPDHSRWAILLSRKSIPYPARVVKCENEPITSYRWGASFESSFCLGMNPTIRSTGWPFLKRIRVGMLITPYCIADWLL